MSEWVRLGSAYRSGSIACVPEFGVPVWTNHRATLLLLFLLLLFLLLPPHCKKRHPSRFVFLSLNLITLCTLCILLQAYICFATYVKYLCPHVFLCLYITIFPSYFSSSMFSLVVTFCLTLSFNLNSCILTLFIYIYIYQQYIYLVGWLRWLITQHANPTTTTVLMITIEMADVKSTREMLMLSSLENGTHDC